MPGGPMIHAGCLSVAVIILSVVGDMKVTPHMQTDNGNGTTMSNSTGHDMDPGNSTGHDMDPGNSTGHDMDHGNSTGHDMDHDMDHGNSTGHDMDHSNSTDHDMHHGNSTGHDMDHDNSTGHDMDHGNSTGHDMDHGNSTGHDMDHGNSTGHDMDHGNSTDHGTDHGTGDGMDHGTDHGTGASGHAGHTSPESMVMYFFFSNNVTILFREWATTNTTYIPSCVGLGLIATFYEGLKVFRQHLLAKECTRRHGEYNCCGTRCFCMHILQMILHVVQVAISYALMLVFMTFNVWLCISVLIGAGLGYLLFSWPQHAKDNYSFPTDDHCY